MRIFNATVVAILLYASETWSLLEADIARLEVFQMSCLRTICGVSLREHQSNASIRSLCNNQPTIKSMIAKSRLRWLGHVARMSESRFCHKSWRTPTPADWRCTHSAPKKTWSKMVLADMKPRLQAYGAANWHRNAMDIIVDVAQDRLQWRRLIYTGQTPAVG